MLRTLAWVYHAGLPHSEIPGSQVATHLPEAYRRYATSFIAFSSQGIHHLPLMPTIPMLTLIITKIFCDETLCSSYKKLDFIFSNPSARREMQWNSPRDANPSRKNKKIRCKASDIAGYQNVRVQISEINPKSDVRPLKSDFLDSTIRGIARKSPSEKCRCANRHKRGRKIIDSPRQAPGGNSGLFLGFP